MYRLLSLVDQFKVRCSCIVSAEHRLASCNCAPHECAEGLALIHAGSVSVSAAANTAIYAGLKFTGLALTVASDLAKSVRKDLIDSQDERVSLTLALTSTLTLPLTSTHGAVPCCDMTPRSPTPGPMSRGPNCRRVMLYARQDSLLGPGHTRTGWLSRRISPVAQSKPCPFMAGHING